MKRTLVPHPIHHPPTTHKPQDGHDSGQFDREKGPLGGRLRAEVERAGVLARRGGWRLVHRGARHNAACRGWQPRRARAAHGGGPRGGRPPQWGGRQTARGREGAWGARASNRRHGGGRDRAPGSTVRQARASAHSPPQAAAAGGSRAPAMKRRRHAATAATVPAPRLGLLDLPDGVLVAIAAALAPLHGGFALACSCKVCDGGREWTAGARARTRGAQTPDPPLLFSACTPSCPATTRSRCSCAPRQPRRPWRACGRCPGRGHGRRLRRSRPRFLPRAPGTR